MTELRPPPNLHSIMIVNHVKADAKSKSLERYAVTDAGMHDSLKLAELVATEDGEVYADSAYRNRLLSDAQKENNRQKSKIRAQIAHVFGFMSQSMKGFNLRYIGRRRNATAIGLINLIYNLARYEQIVRLKLLPRNAA
jgi:IS5 family transposase